VIPFGYFEGLDRRLSNRAEFLVYGHNKFFAHIAGRVCMNLTCLEIGNNSVEIGDEVKLVSKQPDDPNSVMNLSLLMETIPYEFLVKFQANIRKNIINLTNIK
jgi:alanine racemase